MNEYTEKVAKKAKDILNNAPNQSAAHRWDHVKRVCQRALKIAGMLKDEEIDLEALKISALLHDINEPFNQKEEHVKACLIKAKNLLKEINYPEERIKKVLTIISEHSLESGKLPSSIEAKILFDADKLEGSGAIGIARVFIYCGQNGKTPTQAIEWYKDKIEKAMSLTQTKPGKIMTEQNFKYAFTFLEKYKQEEQELT